MDYSYYGFRIGMQWPMPPASNASRYRDSELQYHNASNPGPKLPITLFEARSVTGAYSFWSDSSYTTTKNAYQDCTGCSVEIDRLRDKGKQPQMFRSPRLSNASSDQSTAPSTTQAQNARISVHTTPDNAVQKGFKSRQVSTDQVLTCSEDDEGVVKNEMLPRSLWNHEIDLNTDDPRSLDASGREMQKLKMSIDSSERGVLLRPWLRSPSAGTRSFSSLASIIEEEDLMCH